MCVLRIRDAPINVRDLRSEDAVVVCLELHAHEVRGAVARQRMVEEVERRSAKLNCLVLSDVEALVNTEIRIKERRQAKIAASHAVAKLAELWRGEAIQVHVLVGLEASARVAGGDRKNAVEGRSVVGRRADRMTKRSVLDRQPHVLAGIGLYVAACLPGGGAGDRPAVNQPAGEEVAVNRRAKIKRVRGVDDVGTIDVQNGVVVADVEGVQRAAGDAERLRVGVVGIEGDASTLADQADLSAVVVGVTGVGVHRDRVRAVALVVGEVVRDVGHDLRIDRSRSAGDRIGLEEATQRNLVLVDEVCTADARTVALAAHQDVLCLIADVCNLKQHAVRNLPRDGHVVCVSDADLVIVLVGGVYARRKRAERRCVCTERADLLQRDGLVVGRVVGLYTERGAKRSGVVVVLVVPAIRCPSATNDGLAVAANVVRKAKARRDEDRLNGRSAVGQRAVGCVPVDAGQCLACCDVGRVALGLPDSETVAGEVLPASEMLDTDTEIEGKVAGRLPVVEEVSSSGGVAHIINRIHTVLREAARDAHQEVSKGIDRTNGRSCNGVALGAAGERERSVGVAIGALLVTRMAPEAAHFEGVGPVDDGHIIRDGGRLLDGGVVVAWPEQVRLRDVWQRAGTGRVDGGDQKGNTVVDRTVRVAECGCFHRLQVVGAEGVVQPPVGNANLVGCRRVEDVNVAAAEHVRVHSADHGTAWIGNCVRRVVVDVRDSGLRVAAVLVADEDLVFVVDVEVDATAIDVAVVLVGWLQIVVISAGVARRVGVGGGKELE